MGYIFLLLIGAAVVVGVIVAFMGGRRRPAGRTAPEHDFTYKQPAAESVTPGDSSTASQSTADSAQKHIPPA